MIGGNEETEGNEDTNQEPEPPDIPSIDDNTGMQDETIQVEDEYGNKVTIPKGFEVVEEEGTTVPEGIVIQDKDGNQFVWIPVGRVYKDNTGTNYSDIKLGRYTFDRSNGIPTPVQLAYTEENPKNYEQLIKLETYYQEYATRANPDGIVSNGEDGLNAIAKDLEEFVDSVRNNEGYYLARYEASYGSGNSVADYKPLSKVSTSTTFSTSTIGSLWTNVTQIEAAKISRNMYNNDNSVGVESDLVNSYAYDTAIVFIQEMENTNYANKTSINSSIANTGTIGDEVCNIHDMASNCYEWNTEYSAYISNGSSSTCTVRGGLYYNSTMYTAFRNYLDESFSRNYYSFRTILYVE